MVPRCCLHDERVVPIKKCGRTYGTYDNDDFARIFPKVDFLEFCFVHLIVFVCVSLLCSVTLCMHELYMFQPLLEINIDNGAMT